MTPTKAGDDTINVLGLSTGARKAVAELGIKTISDLGKYTEADLLAVNGCGKTTLREIKSKLKEFQPGLELGVFVCPC